MESSLRNLMWYGCLVILNVHCPNIYHYIQWSFGVTCWEVFSLGKNPYPGVDPFSLIRYLERGERLDKPLNAVCSPEVYGHLSVVDSYHYIKMKSTKVQTLGAKHVVMLM